MVSPQTCSAPTPILANFSEVVTGTGTAVQPKVRVLNSQLSDNSFEVPICPLLLLPQQYAVPSVARPQVLSKISFPVPGATDLNATVLATGVGTNCGGLVMLPAPPEPKKIEPQQYAVPVATVPHVRVAPAVREVNDSPPATGAGLSTNGGTPATPSDLRLFEPQQ